MKIEATRTEVLYTRMFPTTREQLFVAWTDARQVALWWGPDGFTNPVCRWNARLNGEICIHMTAPDGMVFPITGCFHETIFPERVVFTSRAFETEKGEIQLEVLNTVIFTEMNGQTKLTLKATVMRSSPEVRQSLETLHAGLAQSLDKLATYLEKKSP